VAGRDGRERGVSSGDGMAATERCWSIDFSDGRRFTTDPEFVDLARAQGLGVREYVSVDTNDVGPLTYFERALKAEAEVKSLRKRLQQATDALARFVPPGEPTP